MIAARICSEHSRRLRFGAEDQIDSAEDEQRSAEYDAWFVAARARWQADGTVSLAAP